MDTSTGNPLTDMHKATKQYKTNRKLQLSQVERFEFLVCGIQIAYNPQKCLSSTQFLVEASLPQYFFLNQRHTSPSNFPSNYTPWNMLIFCLASTSTDWHSSNLAPFMVQPERIHPTALPLKTRYIYIYFNYETLMKLIFHSICKKHVWCSSCFVIYIIRALS